MITIYHLGMSQSDRIVWLMEELELPYQLEWYDRDEEGLAPESYRALHPAGTAPIVRDGDVVLCESAAIVEYIIHRHGGGRLGVAPEQENYPDYLYWMNFNTSFQATFFVDLALKHAGVEAAADNLVAKALARRQSAYLKFLEDRLGEVDYLAGPDFTAADIMVAFNVTTLPAFGIPGIANLPNVQAYIARLGERPAYARAMAIAGPQARRPEP